jgi:hypothetical protein
MRSGEPFPKFDENGISTMTFGKHKGKSFDELSKHVIRAYLEEYQRGIYTWFKHPELYCQLHLFAFKKFGDWVDTCVLLCSHSPTEHPKSWSCPDHGIPYHMRSPSFAP